MLGCRPNTRITLFWLEMQHRFLQFRAVLECAVGNTSISDSHILRLLGTLLQKISFLPPSLLHGHGKEPSLSIAMPSKNITWELQHLFIFWKAARREKKQNKTKHIILFQKYPSLWIGLCCNPFWIYPRPACLLGCNDNVLDGLQRWVEGADHRQSMIQPRFLSHLWILQPQGKNLYTDWALSICKAHA